MAKKARPPPPPPGHGNNTGGAASPSSSSSSSDFEFLVSLPPTSRKPSAQLCPADELFYKGQLLPLHLSTRLSMVRTLILSDSARNSNGSSASCDSSSTDTTATTTTASPRDSSGSSNDSTASFPGDLLLLAAAAAAAVESKSSRPSCVTEDDVARKAIPRHGRHGKYFSSLATKFSSVFHRNKKDQSNPPPALTHEQQIPNSSSMASASSAAASGGNNNNSSSSAKEVIKKYAKKVRPLYEKLSSLQNKTRQQRVAVDIPPAAIHHPKKTFSFSIKRGDKPSSKTQTLSAAVRSPHPPSKAADLAGIASRDSAREMFSHSFSGNLRYPRKKRCAMAASCPSSMRSSPSHSGLLGSGGGSGNHAFLDSVAALHNSHSLSTASMEDLQSAIQGAIAHCKSSMK